MLNMLIITSSQIFSFLSNILVTDHFNILSHHVYIYLNFSWKGRPAMGFEFGHHVCTQRRPKAAKANTSNGTSVLVWAFEHPDWNLLQLHFAQHVIFIKFALHIPQPHQEEPPEKAHVELVIIHTIYQVSKFIWHCTSVLIQNSTTFKFYDCWYWPLPQLIVSTYIIVLAHSK